MKSPFGDSFDSVLASYSDEDLERLKKEKGMAGLMMHITEESLFGEQIKAIKEKLRKHGYKGYRVLSDSVEEYFIDAKARFMIRNNGASFHIFGQDDRLGENLDNAMAHFSLDTKLVLPDSKCEKAELFIAQLKDPQNEDVGEFMMRTPAEYLKLLIYYAKVNSFADLKTLFRTFEEKKDQLYESASYRAHGNLSVLHKHPVEFVSALSGSILEDIMKRTHVSSLADYTKLFLDNPYMTMFLGTVEPKILDYVMGIAKVNSVDEMIKLTSNDTLKKALLDISSSTKSPDNVVHTFNYFKISNLEGILDFASHERVAYLMGRANKNNFKMLLDFSEPETLVELDKLCWNEVLYENISQVEYSDLQNLLVALKLPEQKVKQYMCEIVTHSYNSAINEGCKQLTQSMKNANVPEALSGFVLSVISDEDYVGQNLDTLGQLLSGRFISTDDNVRDLQELSQLMGGFITPELSKKYMAATSREEKDAVMQNYRKLMSQVMGSAKIDIDDPDLLSEVIYLAYKPTGYTMNEISNMIHGGSLGDLSSHVDKIKVNPNGYDMKFFLMNRSQTADYNRDLLRAIDTPLFHQPKKKKLVDLVYGSLSPKQEDAGSMMLLIGKVLGKLNDDRLTNYRNTYHSDKGISKEYSEQRLETLTEILSIIPKEDQFMTALQELLKDSEIADAAKNSTERYQWLQAKRNFTPEERACKNRIDEIIKILSKDIDANVDALVKSKEISALGEEAVKILDDILANHANSAMLNYLSAIRTKKYLNAGAEKEQTYVDVLYSAMLQETKNAANAVKREIRKVKSVRSDDSAQVKAVVSKNVGSYFAKAGAEICTSRNMRMWYEERHLHLNLVYKDQIIGNIMLYVEPERDYLVARGFNPRMDAMAKFDRYSMASEITRVLEEIARENGYKEVFVPEQTSWHALSNRDGMAKEIEDLSRRNIAKLLSEPGNHRTTIEDSEFYVTEKGGTSIPKLNLLVHV